MIYDKGLVNECVISGLFFFVNLYFKKQGKGEKILNTNIDSFAAKCGNRTI